MLLEKAANQEKKHEKMLNKEEFVAILQEADKVFDEVEAQLAQHAGYQRVLVIIRTGLNPFCCR